MNVITKTVQLPDGKRTISIETGKVAKQAMVLRFYAWATPYF
jgi:polyribonucleotide nucleotidyltransferase